MKEVPAETGEAFPRPSPITRNSQLIGAEGASRFYKDFEGPKDYTILSK
jgi:hypothetical protein